MVGANLTESRWVNLNLSGTDFRGANLENAAFKRVQLTDANLTGASLRHVDVYGRETRVGGATVTGADLTNFDIVDENGDTIPFGKAGMRGIPLKAA